MTDQEKLTAAVREIGWGWYASADPSGWRIVTGPAERVRRAMRTGHVDGAVEVFGDSRAEVVRLALHAVKPDATERAA